VGLVIVQVHIVGVMQRLSGSDSLPIRRIGSMTFFVLSAASFFRQRTGTKKQSRNIVNQLHGPQTCTNDIV
jgi:hypothetical protein